MSNFLDKELKIVKDSVVLFGISIWLYIVKKL